MASGAHTHIVTVASRRARRECRAAPDGSARNCGCRKRRRLPGVPTYPRPLARRPARQSSHAWPSDVRLRMVKESAFGCSSVQSPNAGMYCSRLLATGAMVGAAIPSICALRAALPGSRRSPVRPRTASANKPSCSPTKRTCRSWSASVSGVEKRKPMPRMKSCDSSPSNTMVCNTRRASLPA